MPHSSERFPRQAYARRAAILAEDLAEWISFYRTRALPERSAYISYRTAVIADNRWPQLEDLVARLQEISIDILALR
jgi:hypothetical protein